MFFIADCMDKQIAFAPVFVDVLGVLFLRSVKTEMHNLSCTSVCLSVCLFVCLHISETTQRIMLKYDFEAVFTISSIELTYFSGALSTLHEVRPEINNF